MGKTWEISNHTFPIVWVPFSLPIPILWYTSSYGKSMGFSINFPQFGKMQQNLSYRADLGNWYSYFSHSRGAFFPFNSHPVVYEKYIGFPINFPQHEKIQQNPSYGEDLRNWYQHFSHGMGAFFLLDSHPMVFFITWEMYRFSNQFPIAQENSAKTIKWAKPGK